MMFTISVLYTQKTHKLLQIWYQIVTSLLINCSQVEFAICRKLLAQVWKKLLTIHKKLNGTIYQCWEIVAIRLDI